VTNEPLLPSPLARSRDAGEGELNERLFDRLRWRCRRGMLELDLALGNFLAGRYATLTDADKAAFERLLTAPDADLLNYLQGQAEPADQELSRIVAKIR
jgi:antitoxin CptB